MKRYILLIMIILLSFSVLAASNEWTSYQYDEYNRGSSATTIYNDYDDFANVTTIPKAEGSGFQPLVGDIDNDGKTEIVISDGNFLSVYSLTGNVFVEDGTINMGGTQDSVGYMEDMDGDGLYEIILSFNDFVYTINFNGSAFNTSRVWNLSSSATSTEGGITCEEFSGTWGCYFAGNSTYLNEYNVMLGTGSKYTTGHTLSGATYFAPIIKDIDLIAGHEIVMLVPSSVAIVTIDQTSPTVTKWSSSLYTTNGALRGLIAWDLDGAGDTEVCVTHKYSDGSYLRDGKLTCYNGDGSSFDSDITANNPSTSIAGDIGQPLVIDMDGDGQFELCVMAGMSSSNPSIQVACYVTSGGNLDKQYEFETTSGGWSTSFALSYNSPPVGGLLLNSLTPAFIQGKYIYYLNATSGDLQRTSTGGAASDNFIVADVNDDGFLELIEYASGQTDIWLSSLTNSPPTLEAFKDYSGYGANVDYTNPVCVNTSITFTGDECDSGNSIYCNYINDADTDQERITTNCGTDTDLSASLSSGSYSLSDPSYACVFNTTGIFNVRLYLEDDSNIDDRSQYNTQTISINVIDGISGDTCNVGSITTGDTAVISTQSTTEIDESIDNTLGILTGTSDNMKLLLAFAIIIGLVLMVAQQGITNPMALGLVGVMGIAFVSFFGLLPLWVMITLMLLVILTGLIVVATGRSSGGQ